MYLLIFNALAMLRSQVNNAVTSLKVLRVKQQPMLSMTLGKCGAGIPSGLVGGLWPWYGGPVTMLHSPDYGQATIVGMQSSSVYLISWQRADSEFTQASICILQPSCTRTESMIG